MRDERIDLSAHAHSNGKFASEFVQGVELTIESFRRSMSQIKTPLPAGCGVFVYPVLISGRPRATIESVG